MLYILNNINIYSIIIVFRKIKLFKFFNCLKILSFLVFLKLYNKVINDKKLWCTGEQNINI